MAHVRLILGSIHSARTPQIDQAFLDAAPNATLLLPGNTLARQRKADLIRTHQLPGLLGNPILDLSTFATQLLAQDGITINPLSILERQRLLLSCLDELQEAGDLDMLQVPHDSPGLLNHLLQIITQLKQTAIDPETYTTRLLSRADATLEDILISRAYTTYQEKLLTQKRHDVPGLYWEATLHCQAQRPSGLPENHTLLLDNFDDFTPSEFRFLQALEPHLQTLVLGINYDSTPDRQDCFALPARTVKQIQDAFDCITITCEAAAPSSQSTYLTQHIFWRSQPQPSDDVTDNVTIRPCLNEQHEVEHILGLIKDLHRTQGVPLDEIAITARTLNGLDERLRSTCTEFDIPCRIHQDKPLLNAPLVQRLLQLIQLQGQDNRDVILGLLTEPNLPWEEPLEEKVITTFDRISRHAHTLGPLRQWPQALQTLRQRLDKDPTQKIKHLKARLPEVHACIKAMEHRIQALLQWTTSIQTPQPLAQQLQAVRVLFESFAEIGTPENEPIRKGLHHLLNQLSSTSETPIELPQFIRTLTQALGQCTYTSPRPAQGITILPLEQVRYRAFKHLFILSLNEGVLPQYPSTNALYETQDYIRLNKADIPLEGHQEHRQREMLLFHHSLVAATEHLHLSWTLQRGGREAAPSPYLSEVRSLLPDSVSEPMPQAEDILPPLEQTPSLRSLANSLVHETIPKDAYPPSLQHLQHSIQVEADRQRTHAFGPYDGQLQHEDNLKHLDAQYDDQHRYSANQLQTWLSCPFHFFLERLLNVEDVEVPEPGFDARIRGLILHETLEHFHRWHVTQEELPLDAPESQSHMDHLLDTAFQNHEWKSRSASPGILQAERNTLRHRLHQYLAIEAQAEANQGWQPHAFEHSFDSFSLDTELGQVQFSGRIDRIDQSTAHPNTYRIIDYKTGGIPATKAITDGDNIQLTLYAWYVEQQFADTAACAEAYYLNPGKTDHKECLQHGAKRGWEKREENAKAKIAHAIQSIRNGTFSPLKKNNTCYGCTHANICRYEQSRMERKWVEHGEEGAES